MKIERLSPIYPQRHQGQDFSQTQTAQDDQLNSNKKTKFNTGRWSKEEHSKFIEGIKAYGNEWKKVQRVIKTRSSTQARSHAQKFFLKIKKILNIKNSLNLETEFPPSSQPSFSFSIKHFFELLSSRDNRKNNEDKENLTSLQREKFLSFILKFSNTEFDTNKKSPLIENEGDLEESYSGDEVNEEVNTIKGNYPLKIFEIQKDSSRRESVNSNVQIDNSNKENKNIKDVGSNDNGIYIQMREMFGKRIEYDLVEVDFMQHRFNSTNCESLESERIFDNHNFFPTPKENEGKYESNDNYNGNRANNPFFLNFEFEEQGENIIPPTSETSLFEEENMTRIKSRLI